MRFLDLLKKSRFPVSTAVTDDMEIHKQYLEKNEGKEKKENIKFSHKGSTIQGDFEKAPFFWFVIQNYSFLYIMTPENEEYIYYFPNPEEAIEPLGKIKNNFIYGINLDEKRYCFEIKIGIDGGIMLNFITTQPEGCSVGLNKLFQILNILLSSLKIEGPILLKDDVKVGDKFITYERMLQGKPSIYVKYGFKIISSRLEEIEKAKRLNDTEALKVLYRNIPMVAKDTSKFNL